MSAVKERLLNDLTVKILMDKIQVRESLELAFDLGVEYQKDCGKSEESEQ